MQADAIGADGAFTRGLLRPDFPVPRDVNVESKKRYAVYRNNVTVGLVKAMEANFPAVRRLLGEVYFAGLAREFVQVQPPQSPLLFQYGAAFPDYLAQSEDLSSYPYLADVARLELLYLQAYHEADAPVLQADELATIQPDALMETRFKAHPALRFISSEFAVGSIFNANRSSALQPVSARTIECVVLTRPQHVVLLSMVDAATLEFVAALQNQQTLIDAAEAAFQKDENFDLSASIAFTLQVGALHSISN